MSFDHAITSNDFAREAVPMSSSSTGLHLALIIVGGTIGFSVYVIAAQIGGSLGYAGAAAAFAGGSFILGVMGAWTSYVGAKSRLSTYLLTEFAFGRQGAKIANIAVAMSLIGWYGVISNTLGVASQQMLSEALAIEVSPYLTVTVASALMISITALGFTGIDRLALYLVPFMLLFMAIAAYLALNGTSGEFFEVRQRFSLQTAVSAVIGTYIAGVIIQPDYSRFAVNTRHAIWSVFIALGIAFPVIQYLAAVPSMALGEPDIVLMMAMIGFLVPGFFLMFLGAWASNVLCLYSAGLSLATLMRRVQLRHIVIAIGAVGTALAFIPAQSYIIDYLVVLGVTIPPIGAIYIIDAMFLRRFSLRREALAKEPPFRWTALSAWAIAAATGYATDTTGFGIVHIASIDSLITASALFLILEWGRTKTRRASRPVNRAAPSTGRHS